MKRLRSEIIDLFTGIRYMNESDAASSVEISRYYVHKSIKMRRICKGHAFSLYSYGMDISLLKEIYLNDTRKKRKSKKNMEEK